MYLSVPASILNHSCAPNAALTFSLHGLLSIRSLSPIPASSPLTIAYIDIALPEPLRRAELSDRYHFTCTCPVCTGPLAEPAIDTSGSEFRHLFTRKLPVGTTIPELLRAHAALAPTTKPHQAPMPLLSQHIYLAALDAGHFRLAFSHTLITHFLIDPIITVNAWHPVRVVHSWIMLRIMGAIVTSETPESPVCGNLTIAGENIDPAVVIAGLWNEAHSHVASSHGDDSSFAEEIRVWGKQNGVSGGRIPDKDIKREWGKLRAVAEKEYEGRGEGSTMLVKK